MDYNKYMNVDDISAMEEMARIDDPQARIDSMQGLQGLANGMRMKSLPERGNGRLIGATSGLEALGGIAQNVTGAAMQKGLADKYGSILDQNNAARGNAASKIGSKYMVNALRQNQIPGVESFDYGAYGAVADQIDPY
jgi:hypothetical protein